MGYSRLQVPCWWCYSKFQSWAEEVDAHPLHGYFDLLAEVKKVSFVCSPRSASFVLRDKVTMESHGWFNLCFKVVIAMSLQIWQNKRNQLMPWWYIFVHWSQGKSCLKWKKGRYEASFSVDSMLGRQVLNHDRRSRNRDRFLTYCKRTSLISSQLGWVVFRNVHFKRIFNNGTVIFLTHIWHGISDNSGQMLQWRRFGSHDLHDFNFYLLLKRGFQMVLWNFTLRTLLFLIREEASGSPLAVGGGPLAKVKGLISG